MIELSDFVRVEDVPARIGLSERMLRRRLAAGEVAVYQDPRDRRKRIVRIEEIDRLARPILLRRPSDQPDTAA